MRPAIANRGMKQRGLFFCSVPDSGFVQIKPKNGRTPAAIFPNNIVLYPELQAELAPLATTYWHPALARLSLKGVPWIINSCADADEYRSGLRMLAKATTDSKIPVFNRPEVVLKTTRDKTPDLVSGIPNLIVPKCIKFEPKLPKDFQETFERGGFDYPVLVRPAGSQTGHGLIVVCGPLDWEKIHSIDWAGRELYMTQFVDMRDEDGLHTKIRIAFINRKPFFRHAFSSQDSIVRTLPRTAESMDKEVDFLAALQERPAVKALVAELADRIRLNFWGIDLGIGTDDRFLFFEATAAMSITQAYNTQAEHDRLYPILLEPITHALDIAVKDPSSWDCWS